MTRRKEWALQRASFLGSEKDVPADLWETVSMHTTEYGGWLAWKRLTVDQAVSMAQGYGTHWRVIRVEQRANLRQGA